MSSAGGRRALPAAAVHSLKGPGDVFRLRRLGHAFRGQLAPSVLLVGHALCRVGLGPPMPPDADAEVTRSKVN